MCFNFNFSYLSSTLIQLKAQHFQISFCFLPSTLIRLGSVFKYPHFEQCFQMYRVFISTYMRETMISVIFIIHVSVWTIGKNASMKMVSLWTVYKQKHIILSVDRAKVIFSRVGMTIYINVHPMLYPPPPPFFSLTLIGALCDVTLFC